MKNTPPPPKRRAPGTLKRLADGLGISRRRVQDLLHLGMPDDLDGAKRWREQKSGGSAAEELRRERIGLVRAQRERQETENAVRRGELIPAGEVQESVAATMAGARVALVKALVNDAPARLEGLTANQIAKEMKAIVMTILTQLSTAQYYDSAEVAAIIAQARAEVVKSK